MLAMSSSPTPSVTRSSTASSLTTLLTPSNPVFPPSVRIETSGNGSVTPTRDSFFPPSTKKQPSLHLKRKPFLLEDEKSGLRRSVSASSAATRRAKPTLAMSIHPPAPSTPAARPSGHTRWPSMSENLLREIAGRDDHRRGVQSSASSAKSDNIPQSRHRRRHSTSVHGSHSPAPHGQVLQARLERVLQTATLSSVEPQSPSLFRSQSGRGVQRRVSSKRFDDDKVIPVALEDKVAAWNLPASPQHIQKQPASATTTPKRDQHSLPHTPPNSSLHRPPFTPSPRRQPFSPRSASFSHHHPPPSSSPFLSSPSPRLLLAPPPTPPESPTREMHAEDTSAPSTPPSEGFDPNLASRQCRQMTGYVSFGEVDGLDAGRLCDREPESESNPKKGLRKWRLWS